MAKTVQPIAIELGIKGGEKLSALNRSFRDLSKQIKLSDVDIVQATKDVAKFAQEAGNSEATIKGQIKAFEGLREQAAMGGKAYTALVQEISELKSTLRGSSTAVEAKRKSLVELGSSANATAAQIQDVIQRLTALRGETRLDSDAFNSFGQSIDKLAQRFEKLNQEAQDFASAQARSGRVISASSGAAKQQIKDLDLVTQALREQREELGRLEGEAKVRTGVAGLAERGATSASGRSYEEALAERDVSLKKLLAPKDIQAAKDEIARQLAELQAQIEQKLSGKIKVAFQETARSARESARAMAAAYADGEMLANINRLNKRIGELPNTTTGFNQKLRELQEQLSNTSRDAGNYVQVSLEIARVQREAAAATQGLGAALVRDLNTGVAARNSKNLLEAIGQLQAEMSELNTETTEGSAKYAENARQVNNLQKELDQIANSYRNVADMTRQATASQVDYGAVARQMYLERDQPGYKTPAEIRSKQFLERIDAEGQVLRQTLALPAAGGTTAPGTGAARSGGAVPLRGTRGPLRPIAELPTDLGTIGGRRQRPAGIEAEINDQVRRSYISQTEAVRKNKQAKEAARKADLDLRREIRSAKSAYDGSINSINRLRSALENYRVTLPATSKRFQLFTRDLVELDRKSEEVSRRMGRRRMSAGQLAQAAGATISGGIFGGPEGFLGGAIGTVLGGPGGAFAGAAIGAQVGQFRRQIGQYSAMAAEVDRLRLGLAGASNDFQDFVAAVQATEGASNRLLIPLSDSYRIMTQLKANTVELGISTEDTRKIFEGITASVYKTGGGLAEVEGAMRAVIQVLSKGAPQAEEIRGQLGERLPAAIVDFAKFTKRTPEELADAFQKSKVTLDEFVDFAKNKYDENGKYLGQLADNAAYSGLRYEKALERVQLTTGRVFQTTGAALQDYASSFLLAIDDILNNAAKFGFLQPGPNFLANQALQEEKGLEKLKAQLAETEKLYAKAVDTSGTNFDLMEMLSGETVIAMEKDIANLKEAIKIIEKLEAQTKEREKKREKDEQDAIDASRSKSFLSAVEQRENAIAQARIQLEERAAQIREQAVERAKQLEEGFARQRLDNERKIQDLRLQLSYVEEDIAFGAAEARAIAGGADPETFRVRKEIIDLVRQQKEEEISLERQLLDEQAENTKAIEQFKIDNAKAINQANEDYAKQIGNIQQQYARSVAKIVEEGANRAGERLKISGKIVAELIKQGQAEATLGQFGVYMDDKGTPRMLPGTTLDAQGFEAVQSQVSLYDLAAREIKKYTKELNALPTSAAIVAPAIDSIGVNISDLTGRLNANRSALEATRQQIRGLSKDLSGAELSEAINDVFRAQGAPVFGALRGARAQFAEQRGVLRLRQEGYSESTARQLFAQETAAASALGNLEAARQEAIRQGTPFDEAEYAKIAEGIRKATEETRALTLALENLSTGDKLRTGIVELRDELKALVDPANQITGAANAIGTAFTDSFMSAITGSATAQEALANFFSNTAKYFLDMAAQIIQKMITMAILNQVVGLLPGGFSFSGGSADAGLQAANSMGGIGALPALANGGAFDKGGLVPFAMGGIVDKPTMFAYANGGVGRFGLMGEAGPEAILPLQRGPGGKLGVQASGGSVGDVVVNVDASGTRAQGDNQSASQLGNVIGAAVQAELIKQKRPGGLLA